MITEVTKEQIGEHLYSILTPDQIELITLWLTYKDTDRFNRTGNEQDIQDAINVEISIARGTLRRSLVN